MKGTIEYMLPKDTKAVMRLFREVAEEMQSKASKRNLPTAPPYSEAELRRRAKNKGSVFLVVRLGAEVVGFLLGRVSDHTGSVHWIGIDKRYRNRQYGQGLILRALTEFQNRDCYEAKVFTYPEFDASYKLFEKCGFKKSAHIEKEFFGADLAMMTRKLRRAPAGATTKKIVLAGEAGQGVKIMSQVLARILAKLGKDVSLNVVYGAAVRGGEIEAELIYSDRRIDVPFIERADIRVQLAGTSNRRFKAKEVIIEDSVCGGECKHCAFRCPASHRVPFCQISTEAFGSPIFVNMIALGRLLRLIGIEIEKLYFRKELPALFLEENLSAIRYGYTFRD